LFSKFCNRLRNILNFSRKKNGAAPFSLDLYFQNLPNCLNLARALLAFIVCISHVGWIFGKDNYQLRSLGVYSVTIFFGLSGFLIYQSSVKTNGLMNFALKRVRRIFPAFILVLATTSLVYYPMYIYMSTGSMASVDRKEQLSYFVSNLSLQINKSEIASSLESSGTSVWNPSLWTLKYEFLLYFVCYLMSRLIKNLSKILVPILTLLFAIIANNFQSYGFAFEFSYLAQFFFLGMTIFLYRKKIVISALLVIILIVGLGLSYFVIEKFTITSSILLLLTLIFCIRIQVPYFKKVDYSYGLYLHAGPITHLVVLFVLKAQLSVWFVYALSASLTVVAASISWHLVESRFTNRKTNARSENTGM
jgi:peptidoglycan/LPS O-acetylase OafA/YrhL